MENPPPDYLHFIKIWVQIRNIPLNHYTKEAITLIGEWLGEVKVVAFDPHKPQVQDYVRIQVRFDVSRPLRKSMVAIYRKVDHRWSTSTMKECRRGVMNVSSLIMKKDFCPRLVRKRKDAALERRQGILQEKSAAEKVLGPNDPLFGVLSEEQVGICTITGRKKISTEVLEEMRRYMIMATEEDRLIRIDRIRSSVAEVEKDPILQKTILRLEAPPVITKQVDKGKGRVFDFDLNIVAESQSGAKGAEGKLMASAIRASSNEFHKPLAESQPARQKLEFGQRLILSTVYCPDTTLAGTALVEKSSHTLFDGNSTEHGLKFSMSGPSGVTKKPNKYRRRPHISKRHERKNASTGILQKLYGAEGSAAHVGAKRKGSSEELEDGSVMKKKDARVIPHEGSPKTR
ncbi:uncharacterized protein LOC108824826 [Raphanus sativus]|uniref:Uncharacterized protein LOC108824826 n=1 Tax=Raphanus sativus TaxID=3726 RepID=A0A6J0L0N7_RAPSA|nr:uncharacterized protein LOC108824826 [Raphanus sativus]